MLLVKPCRLSAYSDSKECKTNQTDTVHRCIQYQCTSASHVCELHVWLAGTRMGAQVPAQGVTSTAGVAAHGAFERFLSRVQFDVAKQVSLLGEGGPTLSAVEWPLT